MYDNPPKKGRQFHPGFLERLKQREQMNKKMLNRKPPGDQEELDRIFPPTDPQPTEIVTVPEEKI